MEQVTRGIRNNNPFNIRISNNSWKGKVKLSKNTDKVFEQFIDIDFGLRAGIQLFRRYITRGYNTPRRIINRFAPSSENNVDEYLKFILRFTRLDLDGVIRFNTMDFYNLCSGICMYESGYIFTVAKYVDVCKRFGLPFPFV